MHDTPLEDIFWEAIDKLPYPDVRSTGCVCGDLEQDDPGDIEYSEEFTFTAGKVCNIHIEGGGWIDCRREDGIISITGIFGLAREGDWKNKRILPEAEYLQCHYDLITKTWTCAIDVI